MALDVSGAQIYDALNNTDITVKSATGRIRNLGVGTNKQIEITSITFGGQHPEYYRILDSIKKIDDSDNTQAEPSSGVALPQVSLTGEVDWVASWADFQNTLNVCPNGSTLKLESDLTAVYGDSSLTIPAGKSVTLDLMGHTLNANTAFTGSAVYVQGSLTLRDSVGSGRITGGTNGGVTVTATAAVEGAAAYRGTLLLYGGSITGNTAGTAGGGVYVASGATCYLENGTVTDNTVGGSANFSLNTYISRMYNNASAGDMVKALYNYGESAYPASGRAPADVSAKAFLLDEQTLVPLCPAVVAAAELQGIELARIPL